MNEETRRAIVAEIIAAYQPRMKQAYQFNAKDYVEQWPELTYRQAYEQLMNRVKQGELKTALVASDGQRVRVFWRPGDEGKA